MLARVLMTCSAGILLALGTLHLVYTFSGSRLWPRDPQLQVAMMSVSPRISRELTMWQAWVGFNASHSLCAMLFGVVFGYLALMHPAFLFRSAFLLITGFMLLAALCVLGKVYWFSVPFAGIGVALLCYVASVGAFRWAQA